MDEHKRNQESGSFRLPEGLPANLIALGLSFLLAVIVVPALPSNSTASLHIQAIEAIQTIAPSIKCITQQPTRESTNLNINLAPNVREAFLDTIHSINLLAGHLRTLDPRNHYYQCAIKNQEEEEPGRLLSKSETIAYLSATGIQEVDSILSFYKKNPDLSRSPIRSLSSIRDSLLRISYAEGDLLKFQYIVAAADVIAVCISIFYMWITFIAIRPGVSATHGATQTIITSLAALVFFVTFPLATQDWFTATYSVLPLMFLSFWYTRHLSSHMHTEDPQDGRLHSILSLFRWGSILYSLILLSVAILYWQGSYSVGSYPLQLLAKLNVSNVFFTAALGLFSLQQLTDQPPGITKRLTGWTALILGPGTFTLSIFNYAGWMGNPGYPGNILYRILKNPTGEFSHPVVPPLIEICIARLMICLPFIALVATKIHSRYLERLEFKKFLNDPDPNRPFIRLNLAPGFPVIVTSEGVLVPNSGHKTFTKAGRPPEKLPAEEDADKQNTRIEETTKPEGDEGSPSILNRTRRQFFFARQIAAASRPTNGAMAVCLALLSYLYLPRAWTSERQPSLLSLHCLRSLEVFC